MIDDDGDGVTDEPSEPLFVEGPTFNGRGDSLGTGATAEDRFAGVSLDDGIAQIGLMAQLAAGDAPVIEVDHVQYGTVPEPGAAIGAAALLLAALARRRRS